MLWELHGAVSVQCVTQFAKYEAALPIADGAALRLPQTSMNGSMHVSVQAAAGLA